MKKEGEKRDHYGAPNLRGKAPGWAFSFLGGREPGEFRCLECEGERKGAPFEGKRKVSSPPKKKKKSIGGKRKKRGGPSPAIQPVRGLARLKYNREGKETKKFSASTRR